jgi:uroporphyrinogen-III decarboxylase
VTPRERLFAALDGRPTDRMPIWLLFPWTRQSYYADVCSDPSYAAVMAAARERCLTLDRCHLRSRLFAPEVVDRHEQHVEDGVTVTRRTVAWRGRALVAETRVGPAGTSVRRLLETDADLAFWLDLPLNDDPTALAAELMSALPDFARERAGFRPELGATMLDLGEPIGPLYHASNTESYAIWSLEQGDEIAAWLDRRMVQVREVYRWALAHRLAEVYFLVGSELASPPLVSRATFRRWIVPFATELIGLIRAAGCRVISHYHGAIRDLLEDFRAMGPDALHTIEAPPTGNCTLTQAYEVLGDGITLIGNLQYDRFRAAIPAQIREEVHAILAEAAGRRLILSPSAGPFDTPLPERVRDNYLAFIDAGWEWRPTGI